MKINRFNIFSILILTLIASTLFFLIHTQFNLNQWWLITIYTLISLSILFIYEIINTKKIKQSFGRFINEIKKGNFESSESNIIQKYDFVNLTDIQVELSQLVGQIQDNYTEQKRYIENVSHELMTPIAIIRNKLELLIQSPNIKQDDFKLINDILVKLDRLKKVNEGLVLLSKLDNNHYSNQSEVNLNLIIEEILELFQDQINFNQIEIINQLDHPILVEMNESLAYIMIRNIIKNAVIHNVENGKIYIQDIDKTLTISNTGKVINSSTEKLFERFAVNEESEYSIGLGLSIIQKIATDSHMTLQYLHQAGRHDIILNY
ncbi:MAG: sensor histidine kinase [Putridiphycobacter sp.]